jgi:hypothetical protein
MYDIYGFDNFALCTLSYLVEKGHTCGALIILVNSYASIVDRKNMNVGELFE